MAETIGRIGKIPIILGKISISEDKLTTFLNVNTNDESAIIDFCTKYNFFPTNGSSDPKKSLKTVFKRFQAQFRRIVKRAIDDKITVGDLNKINKKLKMLYPQLVDTQLERILKINNKIDCVENKAAVQLKRKVYSVRANKYEGSDIDLWEALVKQIIVAQKINECLNCHKYFYKNRAWQKFCNNGICKHQFRSQRQNIGKKNIKGKS